jgi:hypothetical protein
VFCEATVFFVLVDSPVEDLREELVLSVSSEVVVLEEPEWWEPEAREPEAWGPEALEPGARESRLGACDRPASTIYRKVGPKARRKRRTLIGRPMGEQKLVEQNRTRTAPGKPSTVAKRLARHFTFGRSRVLTPVPPDQVWVFFRGFPTPSHRGMSHITDKANAGSVSTSQYLPPSFRTHPHRTHPESSRQCG